MNERIPFPKVGISVWDYWTNSDFKKISEAFSACLNTFIRFPPLVFGFGVWLPNGEPQNENIHICPHIKESDYLYRIDPRDTFDLPAPTQIMRTRS